MGIKYYSLLILLMLSLTFVSGSLNFQQNTDVDLKIPCQFNGTNCDGTAVCNISIKYPNESLMIENQQLTNTGNGLPNVSLTDTSVLGTYSTNVVCTQDNISGGSIFSFVISPTGTSLSTGQGILYFLFLIASIIIFLLSLIFSIRLPFKNTRNSEGEIINVNDLKYLKIFLMVMTYVMLMWILGIMRSITSNFLILPGPRLFFEWGYWIMLSFSWPLIVVSLIFSFIIFIQDKKINKAIERGFPEV